MNSLVFVVCLFLVALSLSPASGRTLRVEEVEALRAQQGSTAPLQNPNNNPVVSSPLAFYFFYYGTFADSNDPTSQDYYTPGLIRQFIDDISGSSYANILSQYTGTPGTTATTQFSQAGATYITGYPYGKVLGTNSNNCFLALLKTWLNQYKVPVDPNTQYYIIYSSDVTYQTNGACETGGLACGYHTWYYDQNLQKQILWGQIGSNINNCGGHTGPYTTASNVALSVFSHEVFETVTDPYINAWQDDQGVSGEIGDKCAYMYGTTTPSDFKQGAEYNLKLNGHEYLVQTEWSNEIGGCAISRGNPVVLPSLTGTQSPSRSRAARSPSRTVTRSAAVAATPSNTQSQGAQVSAPSTPTPSVSAPKSVKGSRSASLSAAPSNALPSAQATRSPGSSALPSTQQEVTPSATYTPSVAPSINHAGVCINCPRSECSRVAKVQKVCNKTLHGTPVIDSANGQACCNNIKADTFSFSWSQHQDISCEYPISLNKLARLCLALGRIPTCEDGLNGVRLTCSN